MKQNSEILIYTAPDGTAKLQVQLEDETVWLTQEQMAELFGKELKQLSLIVSMYLDFAELQATNGRLMKMYDWIQKLDDFIKISEKELLINSGKISHQKAIEKSKKEYKKYRKEEDKKYISDFDREVKKLMKKSNKNT